ncbi:MAG: hypothetical protein RIR00_2299, partial [Pseudomonadota bacterium]
MSPQELDPLRFPLRGSRLIEASAGTGKTYTIAALYLRLVLGHGGEDAGFERALTPPEILVVTFTDAATKELRDRIRARLAEAATAFLDPAAVADPLLAALRADFPAAQHPACARKLQLAAEWMDEAAVSTIHGWCNRMLREHAFDSNSLFTQRLETDASELLAEAARDYWRRYLMPLPLASARELARWWATPDALLAAAQPLLAHTAALQATGPAAREPEAALADCAAQRQALLTQLKAPWATWRDELQELLDTARDAKAFNGTKLKKNNYDAWLQAIANWRDDPEMLLPALSESAWHRLSPSGLAEVWKSTPPTHPALAALAGLRGQVAGLPQARDELLLHATAWIADRFAAEQARRAQMGFDDLLTRLDQALGEAGGERLAAAIRQQFPVVLIDEFQDTDLVQYRIFDRVYQVRNCPDSRAIILIGDPKQAIYAFRGADIYAYLAARGATAGRHYTLARNFRSTTAMVAASNAFFELAEARSQGANLAAAQDGGAFLFRSADPGRAVPFYPARAAGRREVWQVRGEPAPALTLWSLPPEPGKSTLSRGDYLQGMAEVCAETMAELLALGQQGQAGFASAAGLQPLRPADLAVLVHRRSEADAIRAALARRGVRSVYLSEKESVFQRPEAAILQYWLAACAEPDDGRALRAALATDLLALDWVALERLNHDEVHWDERVQEFRGYREIWRRQGVLPMLRRLLHAFAVPARLLAAGDSQGERRLTDLLHLAELLQQASALLDGEHALIRYLAEQRAEAAGGSGDARQLRLESDADLVQVVTVHKSKGLEYPLVFLPYACHFRAVTPEDRPLKWHDAEGALHLDLSGDPEAVDRADRERLGEDLRKFYVALTRARYATWLGLAELEDIGRSAVGYLLGGDLAEGLAALTKRCPELRQLTLSSDPVACTPYRPEAGDRRIGPARQTQRPVREAWWIASYSALASRSQPQDATPTAAETPAEAVFREAALGQGGEAFAQPETTWQDFAATAAPDASIAAVPETGVPTAAALPLARPAGSGAEAGLHAFPRGAAVGTFLHDLLEWAAGIGFARLLAEPALLRDTLARRCALRGWEAWIAPLTAWLLDFLQRPLPGQDGVFSLAGAERAVAEMEFWLGVQRV